MYLQIAAIAICCSLSVGCTSVGGSKSGPPIVQTRILLCPQDPPPECEEWELKDKSEFEYNVELEDDWLVGQKIYGTCKPLWDTYIKGWIDCKETYQEYKTGKISR